MATIEYSASSTSITCWVDLGYSADRTYTVVFGLGAEQAQALISTGQSETPPITFDGLEPDTRYTVDAVILYGGTVIDTISRRIRTEEGGGGEEYHYACYDVTNEEYIDGYTNYDDRTTEDDTITEPSPSGYEYEGYIYYSNYAECLNQFFDGGGYDSTNRTTRSLSSPNNYVVFFYRNTGGGGASSISLDIGAGELIPVTVYIAEAGWYTFYTESDYDTYGYLTDASVSGVISSGGKLQPDGTIIGSDDDSGDGNNFSIYAWLDAGAYKVWVRFYSVSTSGTVNLCIDTGRPTFYGKVEANGKNSAVFSALFENGDSEYSRYRYVRLKLNGSWATGYLSSYEYGGATSTFDGGVSGLTPNTLYQYELHLYSYASGSYIDSGYYISGSFKTDESGTGFMIDVGDQFKNAEIWIDNGSTWERYYSNLDNGSTWYNA